MDRIERYDKLAAIQRKRYVDLYKEESQDIDFILFMLRRTELIWLISEMEVKVDEFKRRGKDVGDSERKIQVLKDIERFMYVLQNRFDENEIVISDLKRKIEVYQKNNPKVDLRNYTLQFVNGDVRYVKCEDNY